MGVSVGESYWLMAPGFVIDRSLRTASSEQRRWRRKRRRKRSADRTVTQIVKLPMIQLRFAPSVRCHILLKTCLYMQAFVVRDYLAVTFQTLAGNPHGNQYKTHKRLYSFSWSNLSKKLVVTHHLFSHWMQQIVMNKGMDHLSGFRRKTVKKASGQRLSTASLKGMPRLEKAMQQRLCSLKENLSTWSLLHHQHYWRVTFSAWRVLGRVAAQIKQIRKGIKDTGIWPLIEHRPDMVPLLCPREKDVQLTPQQVLQSILWPHARSTFEDSDDDDVPEETLTLVSACFRRFVEQASSDSLKMLMRFWVGWEVPPRRLKLEVVQSRGPKHLPTAPTCSERLRLPNHYRKFEELEADRTVCLLSVETGFGLV
ncbi:hypothetical protein MHYP_G00362760 [Metynnis hypsauchen]